MKLSLLTTSLLIMSASVSVAQDDGTKTKSKKNEQASNEQKVAVSQKRRIPKMISEGQLLRDADGKTLLVTQNEAGEKTMLEQEQFFLDSRFTYGCGIG